MASLFYLIKKSFAFIILEENIINIILFWNNMPRLKNQ